MISAHRDERMAVIARSQSDEAISVSEGYGNLDRYDCTKIFSSLIRHNLIEFIKERYFP
jgi:hypothetical protein